MSTKQVLNTLFNPLTDDIVVTPGASEGQKMLTHAAGLTLGYGGLTYILRRLAIAADRKDRERQKNVDAETAAAAKYPGMLDKVGKDKSIVGTDIFGPPGSGKFFNRDIDPAHIPIALAVSLAAAYGGYRLASNTGMEEEEDHRRAQIDQKKKMYQKLIQDEYARTRTKTASDSPYVPLGVLIDSIEQDIRNFKEAGITAEDAREIASSPMIGPRAAFAAAGKAAWLWALASLALGYAGSKSYFDERDPARAKQKELEKIKKRMAQAKGPSLILGEEDLPEPVRPAVVTPRKKPASVRIEAPIRRQLPAAAPVPEVPKNKTVVDSSDPYAALLQGG